MIEYPGHAPKEKAAPNDTTPRLYRYTAALVENEGLPTQFLMVHPVRKVRKKVRKVRNLFKLEILGKLRNFEKCEKF